MTTRLVGSLRNLVGEEVSQLESVSEILLKFPEVSYRQQLYDALSEVGLLIREEDSVLTLIPFEKKKGNMYLLANRIHLPAPPIRADVLDSLRKRYNPLTLDTWLWPPPGKPGEWDFKKRVFKSVYEGRSDEYKYHKISIPPELTKKYKIIDKVSLKRAMRKGLIVCIESTAIDVAPDRYNRLTYQPRESHADLPQLHVLYRGTKQRYDQPLMPGMYRNRDLNEVQKFFRIKTFAINLVLETVLGEFGILLTHNEAESIIQHYNILPWSNMVDLTSDINIAKAFASNIRNSDMHPHLYQIIVWNLDMFDTGSKLMNRLRFTRPLEQKAVAHFGLMPGVHSLNMQDIFSLLVSVTEHPIEKDGWKRFGGPSFNIRGVPFPSPFLDKEAYERLEPLLYPVEKDAHAIRVLHRVIRTIERNMSWFPELGGEAEVVRAKARKLLNSLKHSRKNIKKK